MADRNDVYGGGFSYPFQFDDEGGVAYVSGAASVAASLTRLFDTAPGEEFMRPEYGCTLRNLIFEQDTEVFRALAITAVQEAVARWEPRIESILDIQLERDDELSPNTIQIRVFFRLIKDQVVYNFVAPFSIPV